MESQDAVQIIDAVSLQRETFEAPLDDTHVGITGGSAGRNLSHILGGFDADELYIWRVVGRELDQLPPCPTADIDDGLVRGPDRDQAERMLGDVSPAGSHVGGIVVDVGQSRVGLDDGVAGRLHGLLGAVTGPPLARNAAMLSRERKWSISRLSM